MCVGWTGHLVATTVFKPFLAITGATDINVASFGEYILEEVKVMINH